MYVVALSLETVMIFSHRCAHARSANRNAQFNTGETEAANEMVWGVCTVTGTPASRAATRPTTPALALCVWTMSYRSRRNRRQTVHAARRSDAGATGRTRDLITITRMCGATPEASSSAGPHAR